MVYSTNLAPFGGGHLTSDPFPTAPSPSVLKKDPAPSFKCKLYGPKDIVWITLSDSVTYEQIRQIISHELNLDGHAPNPDEPKSVIDDDGWLLKWEDPDRCHSSIRNQNQWATAMNMMLTSQVGGSPSPHLKLFAVVDRHRTRSPSAQKDEERAANWDSVVRMIVIGLVASLVTFSSGSFISLQKMSQKNTDAAAVETVPQPEARGDAAVKRSQNVTLSLKEELARSLVEFAPSDGVELLNQRRTALKKDNSYTNSLVQVGDPVELNQFRKVAFDINAGSYVAVGVLPTVAFSISDGDMFDTDGLAYHGWTGGLQHDGDWVALGDPQNEFSAGDQITVEVNRTTNNDEKMRITFSRNMKLVYSYVLYSESVFIVVKLFEIGDRVSISGGSAGFSFAFAKKQA